MLFVMDKTAGEISIEADAEMKNGKLK